MALAAQLPRAGNDALRAIATRVGDTNEYAFSTAFRRGRGIAPSRYRGAGSPQRDG
jgi:AraC-like DNA-binding protein